MLKSGFYASDNGELHVVFGGRILIDGCAIQRPNGEWIRELSLYEGDKDYEIGEVLRATDRKDNEEFHPVRFKFYDERSIDTLIKQLQELKNLGKRLNIYNYD